MNPTPHLPPSSVPPPARTAPAWIALVTTALCALGAVLWLSTRPDHQSARKPTTVTAPVTDPALAEARAARTAAMRERMDRMQERIARLEKAKKSSPSKPSKPAPRVKPTRPSPEPSPTPRVTIDPECLRNPLCK